MVFEFYKIMDGHPIPQDVTGFQFKLIGSMTVKQFAYLAAGSIMAWIFLSLPLFALIKFPLVILFFLLGFLLAFVPLEGRPLDAIFAYFLKALFAPNQYIYQKVGGQLIPPLPPLPTKALAKSAKPLTKDALQTYFVSLPKSASRRTKNKLDEKEAIFFESIFSLFPKATSPQTQPQDTSAKIITLEEEQEGAPQKQAEDEKKRKEILEKEARLLKQELEQAKAQEEEKQQTPTVASSVHEKVLELEEQLNQVLAERQQLEQQILSLQKKLSAHKQPLQTPVTATAQTETATVRKIPKEMGIKTGVPIVTHDFPNLITGVVKDSRGNVLPNILVEVKDKEGSPVRAFKTNGLGQFASATPLLNGAYQVVFEDPKNEHKFEAVELVANGGVLMSLEIISTDAREELRKSLFS